MKKLQDFSKDSILESNSSIIYGGLKDYKTEDKDKDGKVRFTDVWHDEDNDGKWSIGDSFSMTKA